MINTNCIPFAEFNRRIKILEERLLKAKAKIEVEKDDILTLRESSETARNPLSLKAKRLPIIVSNV